MSFSAQKFVFDGVASDAYNVLISSESGDTTIPTSNDVTIYQEHVYRKSAPYFYGISQQTSLTFPAKIYSPNSEGIDAPVGSKISSWLFGQQEYKKLQLLECDMYDSYFNCFLTNPRTWRVGNLIRGYYFDVVCDNPFALEFPRTITYSYATEIVNSNVVFTNSSDNNDYLYPSLVITMSSFGGSVTITNSSDDGYEFEITGLAAGEVLTIDNDNGILTSDLDLRRLGNFNKNWLRLVKGKNELNISGSPASIAMTYQNQRRMT